MHSAAIALPTPDQGLSHSTPPPRYHSEAPSRTPTSPEERERYASLVGFRNRRLFSSFRSGSGKR